jgi:hypothetical protein
VRFLAALVALVGSAAPAMAQAPPAPPAPGFALTLTWDSAPHALSTARNLETLFDAYGRGTDVFLRALAFDRGGKGVAARLIKSPMDAFAAWFTTLASHEFGHCQQAWLAGAHTCRWVKAPGPYSFGHVISVPRAEVSRMSPAGRQAMIAGGTQATVAGADALKREVFAEGRTDWTAWPLLVLRQADISLYGLTAPSPQNAGPLDYANDMTNYAGVYGARSGHGGEAVHHAIVHGAFWNAADPMTWYAACEYVGGYLAHGNRTARAPGVGAWGRRWMVTTNAWLSEVGVRYRLGVLSRGAAGDVVEIAPSWGEGQPSVGARWSAALRPGLRVRVAGDVWRQRASAAPGPLQLGGSFGAGLAQQHARLTLAGDIGHKSAGVMLGQPQPAGWFFSVSSTIRVSR